MLRLDDPVDTLVDSLVMVDPLVVIQQDAFVLFLLFLQDPDLLFEVVEGFPEFLVNAVCQARHQRKPEVLFHSSERLMDPGVVGKRFRQATAKAQ